MSPACSYARSAAVGCVALTALFAGAADPGRPAIFAVSQTIAQTNPPGFGAEYVHQQRINNWTANPGMEPLHLAGGEVVRIAGGTAMWLERWTTAAHLRST